jgi:hypothetical protein
MPSQSRRAFLASSCAAFLAASGCTAPNASSRLAHTVTVYLGERDESHDVTVTVLDGGGETLFEEEYRLSDDNEADEDATFPEATDPETVVVTVDGTRFERDWPGFEDPELPCEGDNRSGIEVWVENGRDGSPTVRLEANCQHVTTS